MPEWEQMRTDVHERLHELHTGEQSGFLVAAWPGRITVTAREPQEAEMQPDLILRTGHADGGPAPEDVEQRLEDEGWDDGDTLRIAAPYNVDEVAEKLADTLRDVWEGDSQNTYVGTEGPYDDWLHKARERQ